MRWILIVFVLLSVGLINSFAWGITANFTNYLLLALCLYFGLAIDKLKKSQQQLRDDLGALEKKLHKQKSQTQATPEPEVKQAASTATPLPATNFDLWTTDQPIWQDAPQKAPPAVAETNFEALALEIPPKLKVNHAEPVAEQEPGAIEQWLSGGNWIVRAGLGILFIGLVFLAKFAYDYISIPLPLRLAAIGVVGLVLLMVGWRSRLDKPAYGLSLQGGGVATLYLTVLATVKLTGQLPASVALPLMLIVGILAAWLAIQQDAMVLAVIGTIGGFMAPILLSTGHGSHVSLFSFYAVLDVGVLTVALRKAWRPLNLLAFFFTYGVAGLWGLDQYQPEFMLSCLVFLGLFFSLFVAITLLFTQHQTDAGETDRAIDASLLFGVPAASFGYAMHILQAYEYGAAIAAVILSTVYCSLAFTARNRANFAALRSPWTAMALLFATLAVPLACDPRLTSSVWALEGAGVIWYSWRQAALKARLFGYFLIVVGTIGFITHWPSMANTLPIFNASSIGLGILVLAYAVIGLAANQALIADSNDSEVGFITRTAAVGVALTGGILTGTELCQRYPWTVAGLAMPFLLWLWAWALQWFAKRKQWPYLTAPIITLPVLTLLLPIATLDGYSIYSKVELVGLCLVLLGLLAWQAVSLTKLLPDLLSHPSLSGLLPSILALPGISVLMFWWLLLVRARPFLIPDDGLSMQGWFIPLAAAVPMALLWWLSQRQYRESDTSPRLWQALHGMIELPTFSLGIQRRSFIMIALAYVVATACLYSGAHPGVYRPVANLHELVGIGSLLALWIAARSASPVQPQIMRKLSILSFIFANSILSRILANHFGASFTLGIAWHSAVAATTYSIVWTAAALAAMWLASKNARRGLWVAGAGLLCVVAIKLILIDQAQVGTLARIISFLGVGILMLVIGYVAPIPAEEKA